MTNGAKALGPSTMLIYGALYVVPVAALVLRAGSYRYWVVSALGASTWVMLVTGRSRATTALACAVSSLVAVGNIALAASLHIQRAGFNERFFHHLDASSVGMAWHAYLVEVVSIALYWTAMTAAPLRIAQLKRPGTQPAPRRIVWLAATVAALAYAPAVSLAIYAQARQQAQDTPHIIVARQTRDAPVTAGANGGLPNLVFVIAESLEASFGNAELLGEDMTPTLTALEREAMRFTNMIQLPSASWTMGGIVASQCGLPLVLPSVFDHAAKHNRGPHDPVNTLTGAIERLLPDEECLGDILERHGYRNVYIGSAPLAFAGKGSFLATHGYAEQYGWDELRSELPDPDASGYWGLYDEDMLELAWRRLATLAQGPEPFSLMLLTVDTHDVRGFNISSSCGVAPLFTNIGFALRQPPDRELHHPGSESLARHRHRAHVRSPRVPERSHRPHRKRRGPEAPVRDVGANARSTRDRPARDPFRHRTDGTRDTRTQRVQAPQPRGIAAQLREPLAQPRYRADDAGSASAAADPDCPRRTHHVRGGRPAPAHRRPDAGSKPSRLRAARRDLHAALPRRRPLRHGAAWETFESLEANETGALVIGVSNNERFKRAIGAPADASAVYFAGRVGGDAELSIGAVDDRTEITLPEGVFR